MPSLRKPEIMAPAGDFTCLQAALQAGADAVFFGVETFTMRARADAFSTDDLPKIVQTCRKAGAKAYLTLNTLVYENEIERLDTILYAARRAAVDAIIAWDFAACERVKAHGLRLFLSTQFSLANSAAVRFAVRHTGAERVVLAREVSLEDLRSIRRELDEQGFAETEIEVFVHGAMCVSISGRCYLSYDKEGKSGNRGECTQPCRREYAIHENGGDTAFTMGENYLLSPQDLCVLPFLEKLIESGVQSFKIEGRNRSPEYVHAVTKAYREGVDLYVAEKDTPGFAERWEAWKQQAVAVVEKVYNRGFSSGFYLGKPADQWTDKPGSKATERKVYIGKVLNYFPKSAIAQVLLESAPLAEGEELQFQGPTTGVVPLRCPRLHFDDGETASADKGSSPTIAVPAKVRRNDKLYRLEAR